jgi:DNA modification methylase
VSGRAQLYVGNAVDVLRTLPEGSVRCCLTSPPYWGLRDYQTEPLVWGGDPDCAHEWGDEIRRHKGGPHGERGALRGGSRAVVAAQAAVKDIPSGTFCRCGAWRGQLGLEPTPDLYIEHMVGIFREIRRVLAKDGTLWLNMGDCYATGAGKVGEHPGGGEQGARWRGRTSKHDLRKANRPGVNGRGEAQLARKGSNRAQRGDGNDGVAYGPMTQPNRMPIAGLKAKDLVMMPARLALALQADGWWIRRDIIWSKTNPMPESVRDRPTTSHEYLFLLTKSKRYYYDAAAIAEPLTTDPKENYPARAKITGRGQQDFAAVRGNDRDKSGGFPPRRSGNKPSGWDTGDGGHRAKTGRYRSGNKERDIPIAEDPGRGIPWEDNGAGRNARSVWTIATEPYPGAHFATFPKELARRCILAGSAPGDTVLDPFGGSGTTAAVAVGHGRSAIHIDLSPAYLELARQRVGPMLCEVG